MENKVLTFEVGNELDYLKRMVEAGKDYRFHKFSNLSPEKRQEIICEVFAVQLVRQSEEIPSEFSFKKIGNSIRIQKPIKVKLSGKNRFGVLITKTVYEDCTVIILYNPQIVNKTIKFSIEETLECDEISIFQRKFKDYSVRFPDMKIQALVENFYIDLPSNLSYNNDSAILVDFIHVLRSHGLTDAIGTDAVNMKKIYKNAVKFYPLFKNLSVSEQVRIMDEAYSKGREISESRDQATFVKATFEVMAKKRLYRVVRKENRLYMLMKEFKNDEQNIKMLQYKYSVGKITLKECFTPQELWHLLVPGYLK